MSDTGRDFGEDVERAKAIANLDDPDKDMAEHIRYKNQGAQFRVVSRTVSDLRAVYIEKKVNGSWVHEKKLGWESNADELEKQ